MTVRIGDMKTIRDYFKEIILLNIQRRSAVSVLGSLPEAIVSMNAI